MLLDDDWEFNVFGIYYYEKPDQCFVKDFVSIIESTPRLILN